MVIFYNVRVGAKFLNYAAGGIGLLLQTPERYNNQ